MSSRADKFVFAVCVVLGLPALGFGFGFEHGYAQNQRCPTVIGAEYRHASQDGEQVNCFYAVTVKRTRGKGRE